MQSGLDIIPESIFDSFDKQVNFDPLAVLTEKAREKLPVDYFQFYNSISSVYSSKIEGEEIDYDSYFKYKFLNVKYQPDYTKKADDLFSAYEFILDNELIEKNVIKAHKILSRHLLPKSQQGRIRSNPMFVINEEDRIEYVAAEPSIVMREWSRFFGDLGILRREELETREVFYYAAMIHLVFVKIHPMQDGNGRTARLMEKWFLLEKLGKTALAVELEKNYFVNRKTYYYNIRKIGLDYRSLDYARALDFALMTVGSLKPK